MSNDTTDSGWGPEMRADEHIEMYDTFLIGAKYGSIATAVILILMAIFLL